MRKALLIGMEAVTFESLRGTVRGAGADLVLEHLGSAEAALATCRAQPERVEAMVIGPLTGEPVSVAQQVAQADAELGVLLLAHPRELEALKARFQVAPLMGRRTRLQPLESVSSLAVEIQRLAADTRQRRQHLATLHIVSSQLTRAQSLRRRPSAVLDSLLEHAPVGVLELDGEGRVQAFNPASRRILGQLVERFETAPLARLFPPRFEALLETVRATRSGAQAQMEREGLHGTQFLEVALAPLGASQYGSEGFLAVLQDNTAQVRLQREREVLVQQLEAAVRMRDDFLSVASHELRTPLTSMLGWVQLLRAAEPSQDKLKRGLEVIERNAKSQAQLIEDLLDVSRIVSGKLRLEVDAVHLDGTVREAVDSITPAAEAKGITLRMVLDDSLGPVMGDPERLQQVIWNLLTNAVKFTPRGGSIQVTLRRAGSCAEICVRDSGEGIAADFLPYVFDRFRQADATTTRRHGGLGLGLSIVRHLVELHGGQVEVTSEGSQKGSLFIVSLPIAPLRTALRPMAASPETDLVGFDCPAGLAGLKVLLVEDEPDVRELLSAILQRAHVDVRAVGSAAAALEAFREHRPGLVVSDVGMADEDGDALIRKIRALPVEEGGRVPALAVTAQARPEDRKRALLAGFQMHVAKPVPPEEFLLIVATLTGRI